MSSLYLASGQQTRLSSEVQASKYSLAQSTKLKSQSQPAPLMTDRQMDGQEKPLHAGKPAALPRNAGGASWVSPLSLLLIYLDSKAFYGAKGI